MFPPYELEGKVFKKVVKGYNTDEVDEHIDFIIEKYRELYVAYNDLEKKYSRIKAELLNYRSNEESIRQTLESSQYAGEEMIRQAEERSEIILRNAKNECDALIEKVRTSVVFELERKKNIAKEIDEFKQSIYEQYQQHIEFLEKISSTSESDINVDDLDELINQIKGNIVVNTNQELARDFSPSSSVISQNDETEQIPIDIPGADKLINQKGDSSDNNHESNNPDNEDTMEYRVVNLSDDILNAEKIIFGDSQD